MPLSKSEQSMVQLRSEMQELKFNVDKLGGILKSTTASKDKVRDVEYQVKEIKTAIEHLDQTMKNKCEGMHKELDAKHHVLKKELAVLDKELTGTKNRLATFVIGIVSLIAALVIKGAMK